MLTKAFCDRWSQPTLTSLELQEETVPTQLGKAQVINSMLGIPQMINPLILPCAKLRTLLRNHKGLARLRLSNSSKSNNKLQVRDSKEPSLLDQPSSKNEMTDLNVKNF